MDGSDSIVPCTVKVPEKDVGYIAIVCSAWLLFIPGLPSMALEVNVSDDNVNVLTDVLATNCG